MVFIVVLLIVVFGVTAVANVFAGRNLKSRSQRRRSTAETDPEMSLQSLSTFEACRFLNLEEVRLYVALVAAFSSECYVFSKVRLLDVVEPGPGDVAGRNRCIQKHVDFLLVSKRTWYPSAVVELDGPTHARLGQALRDNVKDACLGSAGIPVTRLPVQRDGYTPELCRKAVRLLGQSDKKPG